jgi:AcrR family transcriptional regulator
MRTRDEEKEKRVIEAAKELVVADGFNGFSMNKLAKACGISVATLYIYYKDKDDLLRTIGREIGKRFFETTLTGFSPEMPFAEGLRQQWDNRVYFALHYPIDVAFFEIVRKSPYEKFIIQDRLGDFKEKMGAFFRNAINRGELIELDHTTFWSIAYGPLYTLLEFHREGHAMGGMPFTLRQEEIDKAFDIVLKALTP